MNLHFVKTGRHYKAAFWEINVFVIYDPQLTPYSIPWEKNVKEIRIKELELINYKISVSAKLDKNKHFIQGV